MKKLVVVLLAVALVLPLAACAPKEEDKQYELALILTFAVSTII